MPLMRPRAKMLFELGLQLLAAILHDIERLYSYAQHAALRLLHRETWVDEEHRIALLAQLAQCKYRCESTLHRSYRRHDALLRNVDVDESLDESSGCLVQRVDTRYKRILGAHAPAQRLALCLDADLLGIQSGHALLHAYVTLARLALDIRHDAHELTYRRHAQLMRIAQAVGYTYIVDEPFVQWSIHNALLLLLS